MSFLAPEELKEQPQGLCVSMIVLFRYQFFAPALDLDKDEFRQYQSAGLALFVAEGLFRFYCVPIEMIEWVVVSDRFHLKPLIPLLSGAEGR